MRLIQSLMLTTMFCAGCSSMRSVPGAPARQTAEAPGVAASKSQRSVIAIHPQTSSVRIRIRVPDSPKTVKRSFSIDPAVLPPASADLRLVLSGLPFAFPARYAGKGIWEVEFPKNVLEILAKDSGRATYAGTLNLRGTGSPAFPTELVIERGTIASAG